MQNSTENNTETLSNVNFLGKLSTIDVTKLGKEGMILYSTEKSLFFCPLIIFISDDEILVTKEEDIPADMLVALFKNDPPPIDAQFRFREKELVALLENNPESICDIVTVLDKHSSIKPDDFISLLTNLKKQNFGLSSILATLDWLEPSMMSVLMNVYENGLLDRPYFARLMYQASSTDDDEKEE